MSLLSKTGLRRALLSLCAISVLSAMLAAPALADHGRRGGRYYGGGHYGGGRHYGGGHFRPPFPPFPLPRVFVDLPPLVIVAGRHEPYYRDYDRGGRGYDRGYEDGYGDGYDDRSREEWRQRERYRHSRHDDCDHDYY
jgi:hypothetical protein